jgi:HD-like signal output (HDOD) protein
VAEVIREANSPLFRTAQPVRSIDGAVMVLGENGLRILLARVAFRPIINMQGGALARLVAPRLWAQSDRCALAASLIAPEAGADPFEAYLAGLMLNLGLIVAFRLVDHLDQPVVPQSDAFCDALLDTARVLSAGITTQWELPPFVARAIQRAGRPGAEPLAAPLANALGRADLLAKLRLLVDHGVYSAGEPLVPALLAGPAGRHFERLAASAD